MRRLRDNGPAPEDARPGEREPVDSPVLAPFPPADPVALQGHVHLTAARREDGETVLAAQGFRAPFHVGKPYWDGQVLQVQVVNSTAGILAGDQLELDVQVQRGAALVITTPAATRAYMMKRGDAMCRQRLRVAAGGWLEFAPEPLCPHQDSNYTQNTVVELEDGAEAYYVDALAPGRVGRGERWAWRRLVLGLEVRFGGEPILRERLDGDGAALASAVEFHGTPDAWIATVLVLTSRIAVDDPLWEQLRALPGPGRWCGVTRLRRGGWIIRALAPGGQELRDWCAEIRGRLAAHLPQLRGDLRKL